MATIEADLELARPLPDSDAHLARRLQNQARFQLLSSQPLPFHQLQCHTASLELSR